MFHRPLALAATLLACAALHATPTQLAPATVRTIAGHPLEIRTGGLVSAPATVVFENGLRETLETWKPVIESLAPRAHVFAWNRPGYGRSEVAAGPRDGRTVVEELRRALRETGCPPPYVLVGHSMGGLYVQEFARAHPDEVAGVVLVDAAYPGVIKRSEDFPLYTRIGKRLFFSDTVNREIDAIHATGEQVLALPPRDDIPMTRLFNIPHSADAVAVDFGTVDDDPAVRKRVEAMYPQARNVIVDSDHRIQEANPELVVKAIDEMLQSSATAARLVQVGR